VEQARDAPVWAAVRACARRDGAPVSLRHVVMACADALSAAGAGLSLARGSSPRGPVVASAAAAEELEELQLTLGEGPGIDAAGGGPVLAGDLTRPEEQRRWPAFAPAAAARGVRGMFAFPVAAGAARIGVLDVYRLRAGPLTGEELVQGLLFADVALVLALNERAGIGAAPEGMAGGVASARRAQVHQATGMVAAQLGVPVSDALAALCAHAHARGQGLEDLAADVLARRVRLDTGCAGMPRDIPRLGGAAAGQLRDDGNDPPEPGAQPGGRYGEEASG
jgi:hypothetical protein